MPRGVTLAAAAALATALVFAGCGPAADAERDHLVVYSAGPRPLAEEIIAAFMESTGIPVELFAATTGQIMAKLEAERYRPRADVVVFASGVAAESLKAEGRLLPYDPPWLDETRRQWHDPDNHYFATSAAVVGIALRAAVYAPDIEWEDVLGGGFAGRLTMPSPSRSGSAGDFVLAYTLREGDAAWPRFRSARRRGLEFSAANSQAITSLLIGAYDGIVGAVDYLIYRQIADGADVRMHFPASGGALVTRPAAILADTPVPERAQRFVDFYFTRESQERVAAAHLLPARKDTELSAARRVDGMPPVFEVPAEGALRHHATVLRRFQLEVERAAVVRE
ncbi:MAG: extracellular solute-binding protein [Opitutales bacterium]|nr:extracellular solute-binding protein [Opitutales bacterium]